MAVADIIGGGLTDGGRPNNVTENKLSPTTSRLSRTCSPFKTYHNFAEGYVDIVKLGQQISDLAEARCVHTVLMLG